MPYGTNSVAKVENIRALDAFKTFYEQELTESDDRYSVQPTKSNKTTYRMPATLLWSGFDRWAADQKVELPQYYRTVCARWLTSIKKYESNPKARIEQFPENVKCDISGNPIKFSVHPKSSSSSPIGGQETHYYRLRYREDSKYRVTFRDAYHRPEMDWVANFVNYVTRETSHRQPYTNCNHIMLVELMARCLYLDIGEADVWSQQLQFRGDAPTVNHRRFDNAEVNTKAFLELLRVDKTPGELKQWFTDNEVPFLPEE